MQTTVHCFANPVAAQAFYDGLSLLEMTERPRVRLDKPGWRVWVTTYEDFGEADSQQEDLEDYEVVCHDDMPEEWGKRYVATVVMKTDIPYRCEVTADDKEEAAELFDEGETSSERISESTEWEILDRRTSTDEIQRVLPPRPENPVYPDPRGPVRLVPIWCEDEGYDLNGYVTCTVEVPDGPGYEETLSRLSRIAEEAWAEAQETIEEPGTDDEWVDHMTDAIEAAGFSLNYTVSGEPIRIR